MQVRSLRGLLLFSILAAAALAAAGSPSAASLSDEDKHDIEQALKDKVSALLQEKDANGASFKRGSYSTVFDLQADGTCRTTFHEDTAREETLETRRLLLTLAPDPDRRRAWRIASERVEDTYSGLIRSKPGDETFHRFAAFHLEREGLKITATNGDMYADYRGGKRWGFTLWAPDLAYAYQPPRSDQGELYTLFKDDHEIDVEFTPGSVTIHCDPTTCGDILDGSFRGVEKVSEQDLRPRLRAVYEDYLENLREARKETPFEGFSLPYEPEDRVLSVVIAQNDGDRAVGLVIDNREPLEARYWVAGYGTLYAYHSEATRESGADPYALERRDDGDARYYELESLKGTVDLGFGDGETLDGDVTFGIRIKKPRREIPFRIARLTPIRSSAKEIKNPLMRVDSVTDAGGRELTWVRTGASSGLVILPEAPSAGALLPLHVRFENRDSIYKFTPSYSYVARGGWLPFVRFGDMIKVFDLTVKVPSKYAALCVGKKVEERKEDGVSVTRWVAASPVEFPTVIYGAYQVASSRVEAKKSDGTSIPVTMYVDKIGMGTWQIAPKALIALADQAANALNVYMKVFGVDYPYAKLDLVNDPLGGLYGQAPSSIVYLGSADFWSKGVLGTIGGSDFTKFASTVVAHEVAHQWWGSVVANANDRHYWFVESLAEYASSLYLEAADGKKAYLNKVEDWRREVMDADLLTSVQNAPIEWAGDRNGYYAAVYAKGPYAFHIMRSTWGDKKFFAFLERLAQELRGKEIVTRDIERVAEEVFQAPMDWFFDQWIRGVGIPEYTFTYSVEDAEGGSSVIQGEVSQVVTAGSRETPLPGVYFQALVPIVVEGKDGYGYKKNLIVAGPVTRFKFAVPTKPKAVTLNKFGESLAHDVIVKRQ